MAFVGEIAIGKDNGAAEHFEAIDVSSALPELEVRIRVSDPETKHLVEFNGVEGHFQTVHFAQNIPALTKLCMSGCDVERKKM
jgi:hypothetical protein